MLHLITDLGDIKLIWKEMQETGKQILKKKSCIWQVFSVKPVYSKGTFTSIYMQLQIFREEVRRG